MLTMKKQVNKVVENKKKRVFNTARNKIKHILKNNPNPVGFLLERLEYWRKVLAGTVIPKKKRRRR